MTSSHNVFSLRDSVSQLMYENGYEITSTYNSSGEFIGSRIKQKLVLVTSKIKYGEFYTSEDEDSNIVILHKYTFPDGTCFYECYQEFTYLNENYFFLALKDESGDWFPESLWKQEEMIEKITENFSVDM